MYLCALALLACTAYAGRRLRSSSSDYYGLFSTEQRNQSTDEVYEMPSSRRVELENSQRCRIAELSANHGTSAWSPLSGTNETTRPGFILTVAVLLAAKQRKVRIQNRHRNALPLLKSVSPRAETMREIT